GGTSGLSIGHVSPEAAEGGEIALVRDGDRIAIDIPARSIQLEISAEELEARRQEMLARGPAAFRPGPRDRKVSAAITAYAAMTTRADQAAVRATSRLEPQARAD